MVSRRSGRLPLKPTPASEASAQVEALGTVLGVWAHPDDEAYLSAGIMRLALENRQRVACVTATAGEMGTNDPATWPPEKLGPTRRGELKHSFTALQAGLPGIIEHHWLDQRDDRCADVDPELAAIQLGTVLDQVQPDTILTFEPGGLTGHRDHQAVAAWVSIALETRPSIHRLDAVIARSWVDHFDDTIDINAYFEDDYPSIVDDPDIELNLVLDDDLWAIKDRALRAHATQTLPVIEHLGPELWRAFSIVESFRTNPTNAPTNEK